MPDRLVGSVLEQKLNSASLDVGKAARMSRRARALRYPRYPAERFLRWVAMVLRRPVCVSRGMFWGGRMRLTLPEAVSQRIYRHGIYEVGLTRILCSLLEPGACFLDVGAHMGYFTLLAAHLVGPQGHVTAFEPSESTSALLRRNTEGLPQVTVVQKAVWRQATSIELVDFGPLDCAYNTLYTPRVHETDPRSSRLRAHRYVVETIALDQYCQDTGLTPDLIKIDVEGAELDVLAGAQQTLATARPMFTVEVGDVGEGAPHSSAELVRFAIGLGYRAFSYDESEGAVVRHTVHETYTPDNIVFLPEEKRPPWETKE